MSYMTTDKIRKERDSSLYISRRGNLAYLVNSDAFIDQFSELKSLNGLKDVRVSKRSVTYLENIRVKAGEHFRFELNEQSETPTVDALYENIKEGVSAFVSNELEYDNPANFVIIFFTPCLYILCDETDRPVTVGINARLVKVSDDPWPNP